MGWQNGTCVNDVIATRTLVYKNDISQANVYIHVHHVAAYNKLSKHDEKPVKRPSNYALKPQTKHMQTCKLRRGSV